jgi:hypothetical protein
VQVVPVANVHRNIYFKIDYSLFSIKIIGRPDQLLLSLLRPLSLCERCYFLVKNACKVVSFDHLPYLLRLPFDLASITCRTLFVLASTSLQPRFDHLPYSLRTAIVLRSLYSALFALRTTVHACEYVRTYDGQTVTVCPSYGVPSDFCYLY